MELTNEFEVAAGIETAWQVLTDVERIAPCLPGAELREIAGEEYRGVVKVKVGPITAEYRGAAHFLEQDVAAHRAVLRAEGREARGQGNATATITAVLTDAGATTKVSVVTDLAITGKVAQFGRGVLADVSAKLLRQFAEQLEATVLADAGAGSGAAPSPAPVGEHDPSRSDTAAAARSSRSRAGGSPRRTAAAAPPPAVVPAQEPASAAASREHEPVATGAAVTGSGLDGVGPSRLSGSSGSNSEPIDLLEVAGGSVLRRFAPAFLAGALAVLTGVLGWRWTHRR